jgi:hypothetical protein
MGATTLFTLLVSTKGDAYLRMVAEREKVVSVGLYLYRNEIMNVALTNNRPDYGDEITFRTRD